MNRKIVGIFIMLLLTTPVFSAIATSSFNNHKNPFPCPILLADQKQKEYGDTGWFLHIDQMVAQSFKPTKDTLSKVDLFISKQGENPGQMPVVPAHHTGRARNAAADHIQAWRDQVHLVKDRGIVELQMDVVGQ